MWKFKDLHLEILPDGALACEKRTCIFNNVGLRKKTSRLLNLTCNLFHSVPLFPAIKTPTKNKPQPLVINPPNPPHVVSLSVKERLSVSLMLLHSWFWALLSLVLLRGVEALQMALLVQSSAHRDKHLPQLLHSFRNAAGYRSLAREFHPHLYTSSLHHLHHSTFITVERRLMLNTRTGSPQSTCGQEPSAFLLISLRFT